MADARLEVSGRVREEGGRLVVTVDVANRGDAAASGLAVQGELLGSAAEDSSSAPLAAGASRSVELAFPPEMPRPGVHGLALHLRYSPEGIPPAASPSSQRAYLLLALGANPPPPVHLRVPDARLVRYAEIPVHLESADGAAHRVRMRVLTPVGVNTLDPEVTVDVPAAGTAVAPLRVVRAGAAPGSRAGMVVLASEIEGPVERTAAATATVEVQSPSPWLPRARAPLLAAALALLAAAVAAEWWWFRSNPA